ncbi:hypothetical protein TNCV_2833351 [Trichonephila clavipes]|nr:hypothetical protein TNCV_2833351 [Trichonephila clavipes]
MCGKHVHGILGQLVFKRIQPVDDETDEDEGNNNNESSKGPSKVDMFSALEKAMECVRFHTLHRSHSVFDYPNNCVSERCPVPIDSDKRRSTVLQKIGEVLMHEKFVEAQGPHVGMEIWRLGSHLSFLSRGRHLSSDDAKLYLEYIPKSKQAYKASDKPTTSNSEQVQNQEVVVSSPLGFQGHWTRTLEPPKTRCVEALTSVEDQSSYFWNGMEVKKRTATAGSDVVQSGRPIFDDFFQHLWPYIGNNTANDVFQMVKRLWFIRIDQ